MEIESGGQKVYQSNFLNIAQALGLGKDWRPLLDGVVEGAAAAPQGEKRITRALTISEDFEKFINENKNNEFAQKLIQAIDTLNEIIIHAVRKGSVIVEIEMSEGDWQRFDAALSDGKLTELGITHIDGVPLTPPIPPPAEVARPIRAAILRIELTIRPFARVAALIYAVVSSIFLAVYILIFNILNIGDAGFVLWAPDMRKPAPAATIDWNLIIIYIIIMLIFCVIYLSKTRIK